MHNREDIQRHLIIRIPPAETVRFYSSGCKGANEVLPWTNRFVREYAVDLFMCLPCSLPRRAEGGASGSPNKVW